MLAKILQPVLGFLGLTQIRHVASVGRRRASEPVRRVYSQMERDFGVLAPPIALHAPAPQTLAAAWVLLRETLIVPGLASRPCKEAVATAVSLDNMCPYCASVHNNAFSVLGRSDAAGPAGCELSLEVIADWVLPTTRPGPAGPPPIPVSQEPELVAVAVLLHYLNRMVNVFLRDVPLPPGTPEVALSPVLRVLGRSMLVASRRDHRPGESLALLPAAALPPDLAWAAPHPVIADALGRVCAAMNEAGRRAVSEPIRDIVLGALGGWRGEPRGLSRAWVEDFIGVLPAAQRPSGRLALLVAFASYQVDTTTIAECRATGVDDRGLVELCSWASMAAARRAVSLLPARPSAS